MAFHRLSMPLSIFEVELVAVCPPGADKALANSLIRYLDRKDDGTTHYVLKVTSDKSRMYEFANALHIDVLYIVPFQFQTANLMEI